MTDQPSTPAPQDAQDEAVQQRHAEVLRRYYEAVDARDFDTLLSLFSEDSVYRRPGFPPLEGREDLDRFYREQRQIASGSHTVHTVIHDGSRAAVQGRFVGRMRSGQEMDFGFSDFWTFDADGAATDRETYFSTPLA
ncbi:nuclear transport factor 2 family protein [Micrococcus sp.]|uniref:nuclear transport factor 2 family protein n=1 Tax=Micrococcus sp. TaxID=1271 RepID=UPI002A908F54|nr:nuclear transport factor 2 family protein [Micrococcus sp.]MDY6055238.1 nuclear transport factor 2 family protein [Micrococcus sp.]